MARIFEILKLKGASVEITLCDDRFMRGENARHMKKTGTTDVLSFPQFTPQKSIRAYQKKFLGDILVSLDQGRRQAVLQKIPLRREVLFLILHSILHLLGHDHASTRQKIQMQKLESQIWTKLTICNDQNNC